MSPDTEQAIRMLDSFGARYFELTVNDLKGRKDGYRHHTAPGLRANIAAITGPVTAKLRVLATGQRPFGSWPVADSAEDGSHF